MLQKLRTFFKKAPPPPKQELRLITTAAGVQLFEKTAELWQFRWDEVTRITAYKADLFTVDLICLEFFVASRELTCPAHEEMQCFQELCQQMRHTFPSISETWLQDVTFPAFAPNMAILYECEKPPAS